MSETIAARPATVHRRIRIVFVTITFHPEPGALRGLPLAKYLQATGLYDVVVLTAFPWYPIGRIYPGYEMRAWQWETVEGVRLLRVPLYPSHDASALKRMWTYVSFMFSALVCGLPQLGPVDVVYHADNLPTTGLVALLLGRIKHAPVVQHVGDIWPESVTDSGMVPMNYFGRLMSGTLKRVCDFVYKRNDYVTVLSPGFKRILEKRGVESSRIEVVYNWADEDQFAPAAYDAEFATRLGLHGKFNVIYAGNVGPLQALDVVVEAGALLGDVPNVQIVIVGGGADLDRVQRLATERKVRNVVFLGRLPLADMNRINAIADVLLVHLADRPFLRATIPSKVQVSLHARKPVLLGVRGDAAELIAASGGGMTFEPENSTDLARAIREMAGLQRTSLLSMGVCGRDYYDRYLSMQRGLSRMETVFAGVVNAGLAPRPPLTPDSPIGALRDTNI